jgi:TDG/mug DNA glycosylase family protein
MSDNYKTGKAEGSNVRCFEAIADEDSEILILGSAPSVKSLELGQYYGNPRNTMWKILADIYNDGISFGSYAEKTECLHANHIAMWDVFQCCDRQGSSDSTISKPVYNDLNGFLAKHPKIRKIIANGKTAGKSIPQDITFIQAYSTSPAFTKPYEEKLKSWREILK